MSRRVPHECCVLCQRPLDETGGKRLISTPSHAIRIGTPHFPLGSVRHPARTIRLGGNFRDVIVVFSGEHLWTDEMVERVRQTCEAGRRPWFCQRCARCHLCRQCGTPLTTVPGADYLDETGRTVHAPYFTGFVQRCPNPGCAAAD